jgi:hypothetical protein
MKRTYFPGFSDGNKKYDTLKKTTPPNFIQMLCKGNFYVIYFYA